MRASFTKLRLARCRIVAVVAAHDFGERFFATAAHKRFAQELPLLSQRSRTSRVQPSMNLSRCHDRTGQIWCCCALQRRAQGPALGRLNRFQCVDAFEPRNLRQPRTGWTPRSRAAYPRPRPKARSCGFARSVTKGHQLICCCLF